jgi:hypothetical protein
MDCASVLARSRAWRGAVEFQPGVPDVRSDCPCAVSASGGVPCAVTAPRGTSTPRDWRRSAPPGGDPCGPAAFDPCCLGFGARAFRPTAAWPAAPADLPGSPPASRCARHPTARSQRRALWTDRSRLHPMATAASTTLPRLATRSDMGAARRPPFGLADRLGVLGAVWGASRSGHRAAGAAGCGSSAGGGGRGPQGTGGSFRPPRQPAGCAPAGIAGGRSAARGDGRGVEVPRSVFRTQGTTAH